MGVGNPSQSTTALPSKGSLHKFNSVCAVHLVDELYKNVGAFTLEHLAAVILQVKGELSNLNSKPLFSVLKIDAKAGTYEIRGDFYENYLSCTLIYGFSNLYLGIFGNTTFDNIWLIDRYLPFSPGVDESKPDYGLIINVR
jgi:hypothetical protein